MTQQQYIINRKLSIIDLGRTLGNISDACRKLGVSRRHYYDIKKAIDEEGLEGLLENHGLLLGLATGSPWKSSRGFWIIHFSSRSMAKPGRQMS